MNIVQNSSEWTAKHRKILRGTVKYISSVQSYNLMCNYFCTQILPGEISSNQSMADSIHGRRLNIYRWDKFDYRSCIELERFHSNNFLDVQSEVDFARTRIFALHCPSIVLRIERHHATDTARTMAVFVSQLFTWCQQSPQRSMVDTQVGKYQVRNSIDMTLSWSQAKNCSVSRHWSTKTP